MATAKCSIFCLAVLLLLSACAQDDGPRIRAFEPSASRASGSVERTQTARFARNPNAHIVQPGDSLYLISKRYGVPLRGLIERNGLRPPFTLRPGQSIIVPASRTHIVQSGDTVYGISRRYGVDMSALVARNRINAPYTIRVGQRLEIPGSVQQVASISQTRPETIAVSQPPPPPSELINEPLDAPSERLEPQREEVSVASNAAPSRSNTSPEINSPSKSSIANVRAPRRALEFRMTEAGYPRPVPRPDWLQPEVRLATNRPIPTPAPRAADTFLWPVNGRVISGFGPKAGGLHNDGINIAAPRGAPVLAAENGVVVYSGSELQGFGQMILIKHADGYLTAYGHNSKTLVEQGDTVRRGQAIAQVGSTGNVDRPQLHFEIRKGRKAVDPRSRLST